MSSIVKRADTGMIFLRKTSLGACRESARFTLIPSVAIFLICGARPVVESVIRAGFIFNPFGEVLFGANISALKVSEPVGPFLLARVTELVPTMGRKFARLGARMPGFSRWSKIFRPDDYVCLYRSGPHVYLIDPSVGFCRRGPTLAELIAHSDRSGDQVEPYESWDYADEIPADLVPFDFELRFFTSVQIRGRPFRIVRLLPGYFPDPDSLDNGVLLEWVNATIAR